VKKRRRRLKSALHKDSCFLRGTAQAVPPDRRGGELSRTVRFPGGRGVPGGKGPPAESPQPATLAAPNEERICNSR
jgi:hypothetical protein